MTRNGPKVLSTKYATQKAPQGNSPPSTWRFLAYYIMEIKVKGWMNSLNALELIS